MKHSFAPLAHDAVWFLTKATGVDFTRTDFRSPQWLCVTGREDDGELLGLAVFEFKTAFDAYFNTAIADPKCLTRRVLRAMFSAVFSRAARVSAEIEPGNARAIRQARSMGFRDEGFKRLAIEGNRDALQLGMLRDECRYLSPRRRLPAAFPLIEVIRHGLQSKAA